MKPLPHQHALGREGEEVAAAYLVKKGFRLVQRNYRGRHGEIDLIAWDKGVLVFVEIKTSGSTRFGAPETWVTARKQKRIARTALAYIHQNHLEHTDIRFDVVAIELRSGHHEVRHIANSFWMPDMEGYF